MVNKKQQPKKEEKKKESPSSDRTGVGALWKDLLGWMSKSKDKRPSQWVRQIKRLNTDQETKR